MTYRIVRGTNDQTATWGSHFGWEVGRRAASIALLKDEELAWVTAFDDYRGSDIQIHTAKAREQRFLPRAYVKAVFAYPFVELGCERLTAPVGAWNIQAVRFVQSCGFEYEASLSRASRGHDLLFFVLWRDKCRFIEKAER